MALPAVPDVSLSLQFQVKSLFLPYPQARIYCEDTGNHGKEFTA